MTHDDTEADLAFRKSLEPIPYVPPPDPLPRGLRLCFKCAMAIHPARPAFYVVREEDCSSCREPEGGQVRALVEMLGERREAHLESESRRYKAIKDSIDREQAYWKALDARRAARRESWTRHLFGLLLIGSIVATAIYLSLNERTP